MPDLLDGLRELRGPDQPPSAQARQIGLTRLQGQIDLELGARTPRRRRRTPALLAGAVTAIAAALAVAGALIPTHSLAARTIPERAAAAVTPDQAEILTADIHGVQLRGQSSAVVADYGTTRVWIRRVPGRGVLAFRSLALDSASTGASGQHQGDETASYPSTPPAGAVSLPFTTAVYTAADHRLTVSPGTKSEMAPELFQARTLLAKARAGQDVQLDEHADVDGRPAYKLTWAETSSHLTIEMTLWIDRETYAPVQFTDHSRGLDVHGEPVDETYKATIANFEQLPDTPGNRRLLRMSAHR
jgi:hypothetical protein